MTAGKNIGIITQARMTSTRLPGKVMLEAGKVPLLRHHLYRLRESGLPLIIATTFNPTDDVIAEVAAQEKLPCFRGEEINVLNRFYETAKKLNLDAIIRVTSDCPLIDGLMIADSAQKYLELNDAGVYLSNTIHRTYPRGFDFEIFSFALLEEAYRHAALQPDLEHVTPYIWKNRSGKVRFHHWVQETDYSYFRVTVDTPEDFLLIKTLIEDFDASGLDHRQITEILLKTPRIAALNAGVEQRKA